MSGITTLYKNQLKIPMVIRKKLHFEDNQKFEMTVVNDQTIQIAVIQKKDADQRLKKILKKGFHLGKVKSINREAIYEEVD